MARRFSSQSPPGCQICNPNFVTFYQLSFLNEPFMMIIGQLLWCRPDLIQDFKKGLTKRDWSIYPHLGRQRGVARPSRRRAARSAILTSSRSNNYHSYLHSKTLRSSKVWRTTRKCLQHSRLWQGWRQHLRVKYMKHKSTNAGNSASLQMTMNTSFSRVQARAQILDQRRV